MISAVDASLVSVDASVVGDCVVRFARATVFNVGVVTLVDWTISVDLLGSEAVIAVIVELLDPSVVARFVALVTDLDSVSVSVGVSVEGTAVVS